MSKTEEKNVCEISFTNHSLASLMVNADKTRIREAVDALLSNAIKYRDPTKAKCLINVMLSNTQNMAKIEVIDNGIGIAKEDIAKLGKKFVRLNPKTNGTLQRPGGTGLGLFVVKGIMNFHKGDFIIESPGTGKGSTFILKFPMHKA
jgi:hypothetical protein